MPVAGVQMTSGIEMGVPTNDQDLQMQSLDFLLDHNFLWPQDVDFHFNFSEPGDMPI